MGTWLSYVLHHGWVDSHIIGCCDCNVFGAPNPGKTYIAINNFNLLSLMNWRMPSELSKIVGNRFNHAWHIGIGLW